MTIYEKIQYTRSGKRPTAAAYIDALFRDFIQLHGDRRFGDDPAIVGGIARLGGRPVTVIAIEKGRTTRDRMARNFGMPHPEGYRKALRLMQQAEKFHRPVICFVDTAGAYCGIGAEERGQGQAIAENLVAMSGLKTPILTVLIGEGGSGGALALAVADRVFMLENAVYSVISPEGCASILWKDAARAEEAAACLKLTAHDALSVGITEEVIPEDQLGTPGFYDDLGFKLQEALQTLDALTLPQLLEARYATPASARSASRNKNFHRDGPNRPGAAFPALSRTQSGLLQNARLLVGRWHRQPPVFTVGARIARPLGGADKTSPPSAASIRIPSRGQ